MAFDIEEGSGPGQGGQKAKRSKSFLSCARSKRGSPKALAADWDARACNGPETPRTVVEARADALMRWREGVPIPVTEGPPPRLLARRIDTFRLGARVRFSEAQITAYRQAARDAWEHGETELRVGAWRFSAKRTEKRGVLMLSNADVSLSIDFKAHPRELGDGGRPVGWTITIDARAMFLARHEPRAALGCVLAIVEAFGEVEEVRLRRIDMCADWAGWFIREDDAHHFRRPSGPARVAEWVELESVEGFTSTRYHRGTKMTGVTICPGGDLMFRCYDKTEHLRFMRSEEHEATERECWSLALDGLGYEPARDGDVTRIEFQLRTGVLAEFEGFDALDPREAFDNLSAIWRYCCEKWCALVILDDERRTRCTLDPRWVEAIAVPWNTHQAVPTRARKRKTATAEMFIGCGLSIAAGLGLVTIPGEALPIEAELEAWTRARPIARGESLRRQIREVVTAATNVAIERYIENRDGELDAAIHWAHRRRAAVARHAETLAA